MMHTTEIVSSLWLPLMDDKNLLLPVAAIAEIVPFTKPMVLSDVPVWFVGMLNWRGTQIPLTRFEKMEPYSTWNKIVLEETVPPNNACIAILNRMTQINKDVSIQQFRQYPFFSILLKESPKLLTVSKEMLDVTIKEKNATIPDFQYYWDIIDHLPSRLQWLGKITQRTGDKR